MKKKLLALFAIAAFFVAVFATPVNGKINPECPNGCVGGSTGCYCYGWHNYDEAEWPQ